MMAVDTVNGQVVTTPPVPAWKRIGIKLKFAKELPVGVQTQHSNHDRIQAGKDDDVPVIAEKSVKRRKVDRDDAGDVNSHDRNTLDAVVANGESKPSDGRGKIKVQGENPKLKGQRLSNTPERDDIAVPPTTQPRTKSVTFTPETKQQDGFSAVTLVQGYREKQAAADHLIEPVQESPVSTKSSKKSKTERKNTATHESTSAAERKKIKAQKRKEREQPPDQAQALPQYVNYLTQFHTDKSNWKFNKAKQNDVLKNALNIYRIPKEYEPALITYLTGLQGEAARKRLIDNAIEVAKEIIPEDEESGEIEGMETELARQKAYLEALCRHLELHRRLGPERSEYDEETLAASEQKEKRAERAVAILSELFSQETRLRSEATSVSKHSIEETNAQSDPSATAPKRKRKSRTQTPSVSSSSSSSSDSSGTSSSDDSEDDNVNQSNGHLQTDRASSKTESYSGHLDGPTSVSAALKPTPQHAYQQIRPPPRANIPEGPTHGPAASGAIPAGFQNLSGGANKRRKIFDDELLDQYYGRK